MAPVTTSYLVSGGSNSYLAAEYLVQRIGEEAAQQVNIADKVWRAETINQETLTGHFRVLNPLSNAASATEAADLPQMSWSPTGVTISAGLMGFYVQESKLTDSISPAALSKIAFQGGTALARTLDTALASQFPSFTAGTVGTSGAALTVLNILTGEANLDANFAYGTRYGVLHPHAFANLKANIMTENYGVARITLDAQNNDQIVIGNVTFIKNALVPSINSNSDYAGAMFVEEALGLVVAQNPKVQILDVPKQASFVVECTMAIGTGVTRPTFGVLIQSGKTA